MPCAACGMTTDPALVATIDRHPLDSVYTTIRLWCMKSTTEWRDEAVVAGETTGPGWYYSLPGCGLVGPFETEEEATADERRWR